ncbi:hypothetical protein BB987_16640 [Photorhabdus temperata]|uniref:DUF2829 domain-containing protein n=1 Tax=Photorhabdus khanii NC19 TaxID=1004151 RepID=W3V577_9GAMM|nr:DUF2829 domain-containing protein [Photorhabdus khanii]ETS30194.1 Protein of unknown function (DUF2829) [Photorhabdus khanii NC19]OHV51569.1 hypothetical protein BB987_16640 [Photorhabdus temperata]
MSEIMKPENECPFDPKQYECHCLVAPLGSFSWALIQLKLRKRVARSVWGDKGMYLAITPRVNDLTVEKDSAYAVDGVAVGTKYDYLTHIDLRNEHGNFVPWQPTQEDMMACDWEFFEDKAKPEPQPEPKLETPKYSLAFDVKTEVASLSGTGLWGAQPTNVENNLTTNGRPYNIYWFGPGYGTAAANQLRIDFKAVTGSAAQVPDLDNKTLITTVDGKKYNLGTLTEKSSNSTGQEVHIHYRNGDTAELGKLLEQVGKTFRLHCGWYD